MEFAMDNHQAQPRSMRMDYPNQKGANAMMDQQGRPMPPNGQKPPATDPRSAYFTPPAAPSYSPSMSQSPQKKRGSMFPLISLIVLIVALSGGTFAVWRYVIKPNTVADVVAYKISTQSVATTVGGSGIIYPQNEMDVQYPEAVQVNAVKVQAGQHVNVGTPLMSLDVGQLASQIALAQAKVTTYQQLVAADQVSNPSHVPSDQSQLQLAESELQQLQSQQGNVSSGGNLTSTINGVVTQVNVNAGETVSANTPLLTIMDESNVVVHAKIPLANMGEVKVGQTATVSASAVSNLTVNGQVTQVVPEADPQTDTFEVWVTIPNATQQLLAGMSAFVNIQSTASSLAVPRLAVLNQDSNPQVFVVGSDGRAHLTSVHVVGRSADFIYVDSGLTAGQEVVVQGLDTLLDNQQIKVDSVEP
jgi:RND family efflux transporter MFP subunit